MALAGATVIDIRPVGEASGSTTATTSSSGSRSRVEDVLRSAAKKNRYVYKVPLPSSSSSTTTSSSSEAGKSKRTSRKKQKKKKKTTSWFGFDTDSESDEDNNYYYSSSKEWGNNSDRRSRSDAGTKLGDLDEESGSLRRKSTTRSSGVSVSSSRSSKKKHREDSDVKKKKRVLLSGPQRLVLAIFRKLWIIMPILFLLALFYLIRSVNHARERKSYSNRYSTGYRYSRGEKLVNLDEIPEWKVSDDELRAPPQRRAALLESRRAAVVEAIRHAWRGYREFAWGRDELKPITKRGADWLGLGLTIVDSLDTLLLAGLKEEYREARQWVAEELRFDQSKEVSVFETTIRVLGGMISAFFLTGDRMYIERSQELGTKLFVAYERSPKGIPLPAINLANGKTGSPSWQGGNAVLSEIGTTQMEFYLLSKLTNNNTFAEKTLQIFDILDELPKGDIGLYPVFISPRTGHWTTDKRVTLGALGDSFYEYLLKLSILTKNKLSKYRRMYDKAADAIMKYMAVTTEPSGLTFMIELKSLDDPPKRQSKFDHLACFSGGMFALGSHTDPSSDETRKKKHMELGKGITKFCQLMYARQNTGIAPEIVNINSKSDFAVPSRSKHYLLRPETAESFFVLYRLTGDPIYQEWGWKLFEALERHCRVEHGYSGIRDVTATKEDVAHDDTQQSFLIAETFKYLLLLFSPKDLIPLDQYVFNTEAHPFPILDYEQGFDLERFIEDHTRRGQFLTL